MQYEESDKLDRVRLMRREFELAEERLQELEAVATKITPVLSDMPKGGGTETDSAWAALIDHKAHYEQLAAKYLTACTELQKELSVIKNPSIRVAMERKYISCQTVEYIAEAMHYDRSWVFRLLDKGRKIYYSTYGGE